MLPIVGRGARGRTRCDSISARRVERAELCFAAIVVDIGVDYGVFVWALIESQNGSASDRLDVTFCVDVWLIGLCRCGHGGDVDEEEGEDGNERSAEQHVGGWTGLMDQDLRNVGGCLYRVCVRISDL